jgi:hypothetical protein
MVTENNIKTFFKLQYLSNNQLHKMIKFGSTTVEVLHCTYCICCYVLT